MRQLVSCALFATLVCGFLVFAGCGDNRGNVVTGTVKMKSGEGITAGTILFKGKTKTAKGAITDGTYSVDKVEIGVNKVTIETPLGMDITGKEPPPKIVEGMENPKKQAYAPKKYETGGIADFDVPSGKSTYDIVLEP